jgi:hypothetical protein
MNNKTLVLLTFYQKVAVQLQQTVPYYPTLTLNGLMWKFKTRHLIQNRFHLK